MNTAKIYYDAEGNPCSIWHMVNHSPEWAANRVQVGEQAIEQRDKLIEALRAIVNPIEYLRKEAEEDGNVLDGRAVIALSSGPWFYRGIAERALEGLGEIVR